MAAGSSPHEGAATPGPTPARRWQRVFPGQEPEIATLRRWITSLLPTCAARDDLVVVATEIATNAIAHTASRGTWFAAELALSPSAVCIAVLDCGGPTEPRPEASGPDGESGRGLQMVSALSISAGHTGDHRGRLVWAQLTWESEDLPRPAAEQNSQQDNIRENEQALAQIFAWALPWFGRSTLRWWALTEAEGLISAPSPRELAWRLHKILPPGEDPAPEQEHRQAATSQARFPGKTYSLPRPRGSSGYQHRHDAGNQPDQQHPASSPALTPAGAAALPGRRAL